MVQTPQRDPRARDNNEHAQHGDKSQELYHPSTDMLTKAPIFKPRGVDTLILGNG
jgi:hypothetical protein